MKDDKSKPASARQIRQAARLGVKLDGDETVHRAAQKLNAAAQADALARKREDPYS